MKTLIAFYSRADENYFGGAMRYVKVGNTEIVCNLMKELIDADSFKIEMKNPYSPVYMTCIEEAKKDLRAKARPELVSLPGRRRKEGSFHHWKPGGKFKNERTEMAFRQRTAVMSERRLSWNISY